MAKRKNYEKSCRQLLKLGCIFGDIPPMPDRMPRHDDDVLGLSFFRTCMEGEVESEPFTNLTIPRTYIGRTKCDLVSFEGTDLSESSMCWNEFEDVCFIKTTLRNSDIRASRFVCCEFDEVDLRGCDFRHSEFYGNCTFGGAGMKGVIMTKDQGETIELDDKQRSVIDWRNDPGPEPDGG